MNANVALKELITLDSRTGDMDMTDIMVWLGNRGIPVSVLTRMETLWDVTKKIGEKTARVGKIIILKIVEFIREHPNAAIGMALGASIGALSSMVPFIGPLLAPVATAIGAAYGFCVGAKLDYCSRSDPASPFEGLILIAKDFFKTLAEIFNTLKAEIK
ncbi:MAG: hypothetical protein K2H64_05045 [Desulfovibrio sp.]|nr:hypothetical protein [Desulfovibrio sp.]